MRNWLPDLNRFNLPEPPEWWLKRLHDQDDALVLFPSRLRPNTYVLARRRGFSARLRRLLTGAAVYNPAKSGGDGDVLAAHHLVYVAHVAGTIGQWTTAIFQQLREWDTWAAGGGDAVANTLEQQEIYTSSKIHADLIDSIDHRARDAWRSYQARTGQRNQRANSGAKAKIVPVGTL